MNTITIKATFTEVSNFYAGIKYLTTKELPCFLTLYKNDKALTAASKSFEDARMAIVDRFSKKGEDGKPLVENKQYVIEDLEGFNREYDALLHDETDLTLYTIDQSFLEGRDIALVNVSALIDAGVIAETQPEA